MNTRAGASLRRGRALLGQGLIRRWPCGPAHLVAVEHRTTARRKATKFVYFMSTCMQIVLIMRFCFGALTWSLFDLVNRPKLLLFYGTSVGDVLQYPPFCANFDAAQKRGRRGGSRRRVPRTGACKLQDAGGGFGPLPGVWGPVRKDCSALLKVSRGTVWTCRAMTDQG